MPARRHKSFSVAVSFCAAEESGAAGAANPGFTALNFVSQP
jgi:hypothetical protein